MVDLFGNELIKATCETIYMVIISSTISVVIGLLLGILLFATRKNYLFKQPSINQFLSFAINTTRSIPFIILMISVLPFTRLLVGSTIGMNAAIVPLTLAAIPFYARIADNAFATIDPGLEETGLALGMTPLQFIIKVLIPESIPQLIHGMTLTVIGLVGYSAMAGALGGGGLGELAINYGYQRFDVGVTLKTVIVLVILVQGIQWLGDYLARTRQIKPILAGVLLFAVCSGGYAFYQGQQSPDTIRVGVTAGWSQTVMEVAQKIAKEEYHVNLVIVPFNDYILPNTALADGDIDANIFQHVPYLKAQIQAKHYALVPIAKTFVYPMGFYSLKIHDLKSLANHALVAMPNDPSNLGRALLLLQSQGLIQLKQNVGYLAKLTDIIQNPKQLQFKLLDAAQLPRVLKDADLVAITNDFVKSAGLDIDQALLKESSNSPYANVIVVRESDQHKPLLQTLVAVMHSKAVIEKTEQLFPNGAAVPAW